MYANVYANVNVDRKSEVVLVSVINTVSRVKLALMCGRTWADLKAKTGAMTVYSI